MQGWWKLLIPLALGVAAAALNYMGRSSDVEAVSYVALKKDLKTGEEIKPEHLTNLELPRTMTSLAKSAIPFRDQSVLYGRRVQRSMKKGDLVLWSDVSSGQKAWEKGELLLHLSLDNIPLLEDIRVGQKIAFILPKDLEGTPLKEKAPDAKDKRNYKLVGPFRVHSLGRRFTEDSPLRPSSAGVQEITLFVPAPGEGSDFDGATHDLLTATFSKGAGARRGSIVLYPADPPAPPKEEKAGKDK